MGEPVNKNLWGELEPEEGELKLPPLNFLAKRTTLQKRKKRRAKMNLRRKNPPSRRPLMDCRRLLVSKHPRA